MSICNNLKWFISCCTSIVLASMPFFADSHNFSMPATLRRSTVTLPKSANACRSTTERIGSFNLAARRTPTETCPLSGTLYQLGAFIHRHETLMYSFEDRRGRSSFAPLSFVSRSCRSDSQLAQKRAFPLVPDRAFDVRSRQRRWPRRARCRRTEGE